MSKDKFRKVEHTRMAEAVVELWPWPCAPIFFVGEGYKSCGLET